MLAPPRPPSPPDELEALIREARARQRRRWIGAAAVVALLAGGALAAHSVIGGWTSSGKNGRPPRAVAAAPRCRSDQLRISVAEGGVAGGTAGVSFNFENTSAEACTLRGWPTFSLGMPNGAHVTTRPHQLLTPSGYSVRHPPPIPRVALRPGGIAPWLVNAADGTGLDRACTWSRQLLVVPPGAHSPISVAARLPYCGARTFWVFPVGRAS